MAKKRKAPRPTEPAGPRDINAADARLTIKTYEDVADSEDEHYANQDRIDFDDEPRTKRLRREEQEDEFLEASDEEVFADGAADSSDNSGSDEEEDEEEVPAKRKKGDNKESKKGQQQEVSDDEEDAEGQQQQEGDEGWWGTSRKEYYDADVIETEADALEEEAEARRIQAKKLAKMQDADFAFDEGEWLVPKAEGAAVGNDDEDVVIEVLNDAVVTEEMGPEERYRLLQARYPEFDYLVDEFRDLKPLLGTLQKEAEGKPAKSLEMVKFWVLGCYVASLASYFAILTSPARDSDSAATILSPAELRDHEIMETLMSCRENWVRVKQLKRTKTAASNGGMLSPLDEGAMDLSDSAVLLTKKSRKAKLSKSDIKASQKKAAEKAKKVKAVKQSLADLDNLLKGTKSKAQAEASDGDSAEEVDEGNDARSDFGEDEVLDAKTAAEKAHRKKSLRFYTSQIVQKASKRAGAGRDAGGDIDIPYRERLRDRQARLNLEAEKRGKQDGQNADLGQESGDDGDDTVAREVRDDGDEYYDMVAQTASRKRTDKAARLEAVAHAKKSDRIVENVEAGPGGKRQISYQIQKNKGLMPHRRKEVRNPRVKKRMMYEDKQKKLRSVKAQYKGGEGRGGYQGELTGIKTGLVKSTKL